MKMKILAFRDIKADCYLPPFCVPNVNAAIRELAEEVNNPQTNVAWAKWPADHELYELGEWDSQDGTFYVPHDGNHIERRQLLTMDTLKR